MRASLRLGITYWSTRLRNKPNYLFDAPVNLGKASLDCFIVVVIFSTASIPALVAIVFYGVFNVPGDPALIPRCGSVLCSYDVIYLGVGKQSVLQVTRRWHPRPPHLYVCTCGVALTWKPLHYENNLLGVVFHPWVSPSVWAPTCVRWDALLSIMKFFNSTTAPANPC